VVAELEGAARSSAIATIKTHHYTHSVSSGKSHVFDFCGAIIIWSIPANQYIAKYLLGRKAPVWELSRLWAPDDHSENLLTQAIAFGVKQLVLCEPSCAAVVSYADPNVGHDGGVYRAASWTYCGQCEESRYYRDCNGLVVARRKFHSGRSFLRKAEIEALGYKQIKLPGKQRYAKGLKRWAKKAIARCFVEDKRMTIAEKLAAQSVVTNSVELQRIQALPRRICDLVYEADGGTLQDITELFAKPTSTMRFWPVQSAMLIEAAKADGLFAPVKVGAGKTLTALALPEAMDSKSAVILVKPQLRDQLKDEAAGLYGKNFRLPLDRITIVAYSELSAQSGAFVLEEITPDLIIADEAHCLKNKKSARTKRFLRYMREHPHCRFCALSGTMTVRSVLDYAHLLELALRKNSPLPVSYHELQDWAGALDVKPERPTRPGRLSVFCKNGENHRQGYQRRLLETEGVVATSGKDDIGTSLIVQHIDIAYPEVLADAYKQAVKNWAYDGEEFAEPMELQRFLRQISMGFHYIWDWPGGDPDYDWLEARAAWNKEVREQLKRSRPGLDSPGLIEKAVAAGKLSSDAWAAWAAVKDRPQPPTKTIWVEKFLAKAVFAWIRGFSDKQRRGIIWYSHQAVGEYLSDYCGLPLYGPDKDPRKATEQVIVASLNAHGDGKNLQPFSEQLFTSLPGNGKTVEQAMGRSHRPGQLADTVNVSWFSHTGVLKGSLDKVLADAEYVEATTGQRQKILYATRL